MHHYGNEEAKKGENMLDDEEFVGQVPQGGDGG